MGVLSFFCLFFVKKERKQIVARWSINMLVEDLGFRMEG